MADFWGRDVCRFDLAGSRTGLLRRLPDARTILWMQGLQSGIMDWPQSKLLGVVWGGEQAGMAFFLNRK